MNAEGNGSSYPIYIDEAACLLCSRCLAQRACKGMAIIRFDREEAPVVDVARCRLCWACLPHCPAQAVIKP